MRCIQIDNVNQALSEGLRVLGHSGVESESRNGRVLMLNEPVATTYERPWCRVLFSPLRNANPFFHFMESLWMLAGRDDVEFVARFNKGMTQYSDDGATLHGAYGQRWRSQFGFDQLTEVIAELKTDPLSRRAVLAMWSPELDLNQQGKDFPCNTHVYFDRRDGKLNMTVCNRSNDIWWGAYGANAVHMSYLQEYVALALGASIGRYTQMSNNYHLYPDKLPEIYDDGVLVTAQKATLEMLSDDARHADYYTAHGAPYTKRVPADKQPTQLGLFSAGQNERFDDALAAWLESPAESGESVYLATVARPMYRAWEAFKGGHLQAAFAHSRTIADGAWNIACTQWLERVAVKQAEKQNMVEATSAD